MTNFRSTAAAAAALVGLLGLVCLAHVATAQVGGQVLSLTPTPGLNQTEIVVFMNFTTIAIQPCNVTITFIKTGRNVLMSYPTALCEIQPVFESTNLLFGPFPPEIQPDLAQPSVPAVIYNTFNGWGPQQFPPVGCDIHMVGESSFMTVPSYFEDGYMALPYAYGDLWSDAGIAPNPSFLIGLAGGLCSYPTKTAAVPALG